MIYLVTNQKQVFINETYTIISVEKSLELLKPLKYISIDTETTGLSAISCDLLCLQLGNKEFQIVIDCTSINVLRYKELLEDKSKIFIFQNAKFDLQFLFKYKIIINTLYDTFLGESVLYMGLDDVRKSLGVLAYKYCNKKLNKSITSLIPTEGLSTRVIVYAAEDIMYLEDIMKAQLIEVDKKELRVALNQDLEFVKALAYCEFCGIYLDKDMWQNKMTEDKTNLLDASKELNDWILENNFSKYIEAQLDLWSSERKCNINWASSQQVVPLFKDLGINTEVKDKKTGKLKDSVEAKVIKSQQNKSTIIPIYLKYKEYEKECSTYGQSFIDAINPITNRIHPSFKQLVSTGRMSCGDKTNKSPNLQNIPAEVRVRSCFKAQGDNVLVVADYSGQESCITVNQCQDVDLLQFYYSGNTDLHSFVASKIFPELKDKSLKEIKDNFPSKRQLSKGANFCFNYGGSGATMAINIGIPIEEGDKVYDAYFKAFPGLKNYFDICELEGLNQGYVQFNNISKRKSYFSEFSHFKDLEDIVTTKGYWDTYREEKALRSSKFKSELYPVVREYFKLKGIFRRRSINYRVQGTAAEITKIAITNFYNWILKEGLLGKILIINIIHDEILAECSQDLAELVLINLKKCMEDAGKEYCPLVPLKADPVITKWWTH